MSNRLIAIILSLVLGTLGIHKFYTGRIAQGVIMLLLCFTGISLIWALIDFIRYICMSNAEFDRRYHQG